MGPESELLGSPPKAKNDVPSRRGHSDSQFKIGTPLGFVVTSIWTLAGSHELERLMARVSFTANVTIHRRTSDAGQSVLAISPFNPLLVLKLTSPPSIYRVSPTTTAILT